MARLDGKVAIITGGGAGIGAATAELMVAEGGRVVVADINRDTAEAVAERLGDAAVAVHADVRSESDVRRLVDTAMSTFGRLDVLHNNAVAMNNDDKDAVETADEVWHNAFDMVLMSAVWAARHGVPAMLQTGGGSIVNMSTEAVRAATGSKTAYSCLKAALETHSLYIAAQYGSQGVRSNVVSPGLVVTEMMKQVLAPELLEAMAQGAAAGRACLPDDVAEVVVFLASDAARYVSGQVIQVTGGGPRPHAW
ncbi:MAG: SDR family NAD(P)-dependent oxidoreductase [Mycobacteriales bacterium]